MTAQQFLDRKDLISSSVWAGHVVVFFVFLYVFGHVLGERLRMPESWQTDMIILIPPIVLVMVSWWFMQKWLLRAFAKRHPEMDNLPKWVGIMGPEFVADYPLDEASAIVAAQSARKRLEDALTKAWIANQFFQTAKNLRDTFKAGTPPYKFAEAEYKRWAPLADQYDAEYRRIRDFFIKKLGILA